VHDHNVALAQELQHCLVLRSVDIFAGRLAKVRCFRMASDRLFVLDRSHSDQAGDLR
jgi:hypothetical protein